MVDHGTPSFCRACQEFHDEASCAKYREINGEEPIEFEGNNFFGFLDGMYDFMLENDTINNLMTFYITRLFLAN